MMVLIFYWFMNIKKEQKIKAQEWVVMFDGQIKKSEKKIDSCEHHLEVNNQKSEQRLDFVDVGQTVKMMFLFKLVHFFRVFILRCK